VIGLPHIDDSDEFADMDVQIEAAKAIEAAGLDACRATDHPFPVIDEARIAHHTLDPFVLFGCVARETARLGLHFQVVVLPYRNPFLVANAVNVVDNASGGGRVVLGVAAGYLRPEFAALGVSFDDRDQLMVDGIAALREAWTGEPVTGSTSHWTAAGNTLVPVPKTRPHPPIWMGGNSRAAIDRAVAFCDGWLPSGMSAERAKFANSVSVGSLELLRGRLAIMHELCERYARATPPEVCFVNPPGTTWSSDPSDPRGREQIEELEELGVSWVSFRFAASSRGELLEKIAAFGELVAS
jgi:probable F420-dependent oxidoreductase